MNAATTDMFSQNNPMLIPKNIKGNYLFNDIISVGPEIQLTDNVKENSFTEILNSLSGSTGKISVDNTIMQFKNLLSSLKDEMGVDLSGENIVHVPVNVFKQLKGSGIVNKDALKEIEIKDTAASSTDAGVVLAGSAAGINFALTELSGGNINSGTPDLVELDGKKYKVELLNIINANEENQNPDIEKPNVTNPISNNKSKQQNIEINNSKISSSFNKNELVDESVISSPESENVTDNLTKLPLNNNDSESELLSTNTKIKLQQIPENAKPSTVSQTDTGETSIVEPFQQNEFVTPATKNTNQESVNFKAMNHNPDEFNNKEVETVPGNNVTVNYDDNEKVISGKYENILESSIEVKTEKSDNKNLDKSGNINLNKSDNINLSKSGNINLDESGEINLDKSGNTNLNKSDNIHLKKSAISTREYHQEKFIKSAKANVPAQFPEDSMKEEIKTQINTTHKHKIQSNNNSPQEAELRTGIIKNINQFVEKGDESSKKLVFKITQIDQETKNSFLNEVKLAKTITGKEFADFNKRISEKLFTNSRSIGNKSNYNVTKFGIPEQTGNKSIEDKKLKFEKPNKQEFNRQPKIGISTEKGSHGDVKFSQNNKNTQHSTPDKSAVSSSSHKEYHSDDFSQKGSQNNDTGFAKLDSSKLSANESNNASRPNFDNLVKENIAGNKFQDNINNIQSLANKINNRTITTDSQIQQHVQPEVKFVKYDELKHEITKYFSSGKQHVVELKINPKEFGDVKIMLDVSRNVVNARLDVENEQIKYLLNNHVAQLKEAMQQQGLVLNQFNINYDTNFNKSKTKSGKPSAPHKINKKAELNNEEYNTQRRISKNMGYNSFDYIA